MSCRGPAFRSDGDRAKDSVRSITDSVPIDIRANVAADRNMTFAIPGRRVRLLTEIAAT